MSDERRWSEPLPPVTVVESERKDPRPCCMVRASVGESCDHAIGIKPPPSKPQTK